MSSLPEYEDKPIISIVGIIIYLLFSALFIAAILTVVYMKLN